MESPLWFSILIWLGIIVGCTWIALKARSRAARIIGYIALAVLVVFAAVVGYTWVTLARPLPPASAQEVAAARAGLAELVAAWCADSWDEVWARTAALGKVEEKRDTYIGIWKSHKTEDFPSGVTPDEFADIWVYRPPIGVLKIWTAIMLPSGKADTQDAVNRLTAKLLREGVVCLRYELQGKPYMNIIVNEAGVWRPMVLPADFPADFLDKPLARAGDKL